MPGCLTVKTVPLLDFLISSRNQHQKILFGQDYVCPKKLQLKFLNHLHKLTLVCQSIYPCNLPKELVPQLLPLKQDFSQSVSAKYDGYDLNFLESALGVV